MKIKLTNKIQIYNASKRLRRKIIKKTILINPIWKENNIRKRWNGGTEKYITGHTYSKKYFSVPIGLFDDVLKIIKKYPHKIIDKRISIPTNFQFKGELRELQQKPCNTIIKHENGIIDAATGAGKTIMFLHTIATLKQRTAIIVHTKKLMKQWFVQVQKFLNVSIHEIGLVGDSYFRIGRRITICLCDTAFQNKEELKKEFGMIIVDECHRTPSMTFSEIVSSSHAKYKFGTSATVFRNDGLNDLIHWYIGPVRFNVDSDKLKQKGNIIEPDFFMVGTKFKRKKTTRNNYDSLLCQLISNRERNTLICRIIKNEIKNGRICIVLSDRIKHCTILKQMLKRKHNIKSLILTGQNVNKQGDHVSHMLDTKQISCVFATSQLIGEGSDFVHLSALFLVTPIAFRGRLIQYIGRVMRYEKSKLKPRVYDFADWEVDTLLRSARKRIKEYYGKKIKHIM